LRSLRAIREANAGRPVFATNLPLNLLRGNDRKAPDPISWAAWQLCPRLTYRKAIFDDRRWGEADFVFSGILLDFLHTASIGALTESRPPSSRIPDAAGASGLLLVRAAAVAAPIRRTAHDKHEHRERRCCTRYRKL
jgi:hypothetical protein